MEGCHLPQENQTQMEIRSCARPTMLIAVGLIGVLLASSPARATEPRPWLCRDKPVFSWNHPMNFELSARPGTQWRMFFMQFEPDSAHDGFSITQTHELGPRSISVKGKLAPGRYFAVALRRESGGLWICPGYARESPKFTPGIVSKLCYGESGASCDVNLLVTPDHSIAQP
jgi:hypothetical protein